MHKIDSYINMAAAVAPQVGAVTRIAIGAEDRLVRVRAVECATRGRVRVGVEFLDAPETEPPGLKVAA